MKLSLIVATKGRVEELCRLFDSLTRQEHEDFEVILVDQNLDGRLNTLVDGYLKRLQINHLLQEKPGLSRARNVGRKYINGDIVCFPDDDSVYPPNVLHQVNETLTLHQESDGIVVSIRAIDDDDYAFDTCGGTGKSAEIDHQLAYNVGVSHSMFFRREIADVLDFDEQMGAGAGTSWGSGEDTDYLFRVLAHGYRICYEADFFVRHPRPLADPSLSRRLRRGLSYGLGNGYFLAKHQQPLSLFKPQPVGHPFLRLALTAFRQRAFSLGAYYLTKGVGTYIGHRTGRRRFTNAGYARLKERNSEARDNT